MTMTTTTPTARDAWREAHQRFRSAANIRNYSYAAQQGDPLCWLDESGVDWSDPRVIWGFFGPQTARDDYYNEHTAVLEHDAEREWERMSGGAAYAAYNDLDDLPF